ncbi:MAG: T9SS type A sorting domain-containing protein [Bacteroidia bacterium]|nr:T9SS type A sorting domain-containing protein [Bacteroidia bacterium]
MKKRLLSVIAFSLMAFSLKSQCTIANYMSAYRIPVAAYPYFSASSAVTVSATTTGGVTTLTDFVYSCGGNSYSGASPTWWLNAATQSIILNFSAAVTRFTVLVNGTNDTERFYYAANTGAITLSDYCATGFVPAGANISYTSTTTGGGIISINNPTGATSYTMTHNGLGAGSRVTVLDCFVRLAPLPIELSSFKGQCRSNDVIELNWTTASEIGNDYFTLEKSADAVNWTAIAMIDGSGNSNQTKEYSYRDKSTNELSYYRLKQTDFNKNFEYSEIISVGDCKTKSQGYLKVYPIPASNELVISTDADGSHLELKNIFGEKIMELKIERGESKIDVSSLPAGTFYLYNSADSKVQKIIITK